MGAHLDGYRPGARGALNTPRSKEGEQKQPVSITLDKYSGFPNDMPSSRVQVWLQLHSSRVNRLPAPQLQEPRHGGARLWSRWLGRDLCNTESGLSQAALLYTGTAEQLREAPVHVPCSLLSQGHCHPHGEGQAFCTVCTEDTSRGHGEGPQSPRRAILLILSFSDAHNLGPATVPI